jgi:hypothetical protein
MLDMTEYLVDVLILNGSEHGHLLKGILLQVNVFRLKGKFTNDFDYNADYLYRYAGNKKSQTLLTSITDIKEH